ncbi:DUF3459 domain-containing protein [Kineococcus sp. R8]|uniref:glycoside hydrolase family 13 protein n=1 Tax=Kineococcus siccus TaxID=2696567 RepID=UPI0014126F1C|nr:glycoside hydrolase family 13 protein [Kineococcus siccus]NAZ82463.1 DUF3459 domain-containing protein [Kineococcus siccus]
MRDSRPAPGATDARDPATADTGWWREAVVYQVYVRSFADSDGDGLGDVGGLRARLPHLVDLGVDALWINPWYPSPMADGGYDVADYRDVEPAFGTLADAEELLAEAHAAGLRVLLDVVPNHSSDAHPWFREALAGSAAARARFVFRPGRGPAGAEPPNDWESAFGGPAWTRTHAADGTPGDWYLHLFAPGQPDFDWTNPEVREDFVRTLRFWFDRGVDGFRIDVAHGLVKTEGLPDADLPPGADRSHPHPAWDQDGVHEIYREWRRIADSYDPPRVFVAEAWVRSSERLADYLRPDELHTAFQFDFLRAPWRADLLRSVAEEALAAAARVGAPSTWVLSNHDVPRHVTRYARPQPEAVLDLDAYREHSSGQVPDLATGLRRARAAALLMLALPGTAYVYQGEELGLEEVEDLPDALRQDPVWVQSGFTDPGRDGCRVPLPWTGEGPSLGFSPSGAGRPWLPQPPHWAGLAVDVQRDDPASVLSLYRDALRLRREHLLGRDDVAFPPAAPGVLVLRRGDVEVTVNTTAEPVALPAGRLLLASTPLGDGGLLPADAAAWTTRG